MFFLKVITKLIGFWLVGFFLFFSISPDDRDSLIQTDAIVVFTGSKGRIEAGLHLFDQGYGNLLYISGVGSKTAKARLKKHKIPQKLPKKKHKHIQFGMARNTFENAQETAKWIQKNKIQSVRLVTAPYHLQRSITTLKQIVPHIIFVAHPSDISNEDPRKILSLYLSEYHKCVYLFVKNLFASFV